MNDNAELYEKEQDLNKRFINGLLHPVWSNMSHEIRTPMNAIMGLSEILMNMANDAEIRECAKSIQAASRDLLVTINNIIDYENALYGQITINNDTFDLSNLLFEVIQITKVNVVDKKVKFYVDVCPDYPVLLRADAERIKQVVAQLLSNASKFTIEGFIKFTVDCKEEDGKLLLTFSVEDSGIGMNKSNMVSVFEPYEQADSSPSRNVGGLGIGLSLAKEIVDAMGGTLTVESTEGVGTKATFSIKVDIENKELANQVSDKETKRVAVFLDDSTENDIAIKCLERLNVECFKLDNMGSLFLQEDKKRITHLFISHERYRQIKDIKEIRELNITLVVGSEYYKEWIHDDNARFIRKPYWYKEAARALNNEDNNEDVDNIKEVLTAKKAKVLVVDDNGINLKVSAGLLLNHDITADLALSGEEAIRMVSSNYYDIVFMDYMMPDMDGIETTKRIRELGDDIYYKNLPIIALSANAIDGVRERFLENGMNGYLPKPVEASDLEKTLAKYLPKELITIVRREVTDSKEDKNEFKEFKKISYESGLYFTNGDRAMYKNILKDFSDAINDKQRLINSLIENEDIGRFTIEIHSLKSTSKTIGATDLSDKALELERLGHRREADKILEGMESLNNEIALVKKDLAVIFGEPVEEVEEEKPEPNKEEIRELLRNIFYAADDFDYEKATDNLNEIAKYKYPDKILKICKAMHDCIEDIDYEGTRMKALEMLTFMQE